MAERVAAAGPFTVIANVLERVLLPTPVFKYCGAVVPPHTNPEPSPQKFFLKSKMNFMEESIPNLFNEPVMLAGKPGLKLIAPDLTIEIGTVTITFFASNWFPDLSVNK